MNKLLYEKLIMIRMRLPLEWAFPSALFNKEVNDDIPPDLTNISDK